MGANLRHAQVALQIHGRASDCILEREDENHICIAGLKDRKKVYLDGCFDASATADDLSTRCNLDALAFEAVNGLSTALFVAGAGRKFLHNRTDIFINLLTSLNAHLAADPTLAVKFAHVAVADSKCVDLMRDQHVDVAAHGGTWAEEVYQPLVTCEDLAARLKKGYSMPYLMSVRIESRTGGRRTQGHLMMGDLGLPCFDASVPEAKLRARGAGLSMSVRAGMRIFSMLTTSGVEGPLPHDASILTTICREFFGGSGRPVFVLHLDSAGEDVGGASDAEITGLVQMAETIRKLRVIAVPNEMDPVIGELERSNEELGSKLDGLVNEIEVVRTTGDATSKELEARHEKQIAEIRDEHAEELETQRQAYRVKTAALREQRGNLETELTALRDQSQAEIRTLKESHELELTEMKEAQAAKGVVDRLETATLRFENAALDETARKLRVEALHLTQERQQLRLEVERLERSLSLANDRRERLVEMQTQTARESAALERESAEIRSTLERKVADTERAAHVAAEAAETVLASTRSDLATAESALASSEVTVQNHTASIAELETIVAELGAAGTEKDQILALLETQLEESSVALQSMQSSRNEATSTLHSLRLELTASVAALTNAESGIVALTSELAECRRSHADEVAELRTHLDATREAAQTRARESERSEGRFEGERDGWVREKSGWDRERDRLEKEIAELRIEVARAKVEGAGEEDKIKTWFERIESENRALRAEVAEVKTLRRQRRDSDFETVRVHSRAERLEAQNKKLEEENQRKQVEWARERDTLVRQAMEAAAVAAAAATKVKPTKRAGKKVLEVVEDDEEDEEEEEERDLAKAAEPPTAPASAPSQNRGKKQAAKEAFPEESEPAIVEPRIETNKTKRAPGSEPEPALPKPKSKAKKTVVPPVVDEEAEPNTASSKPSPQKRKRKPKAAAPLIPPPNPVSEDEEQENVISEDIEDTADIEPVAAPSKKSRTGRSKPPKPALKVMEADNEGLSDVYAEENAGRKPRRKTNKEWWKLGGEPEAVDDEEIAKGDNAAAPAVPAKKRAKKKGQVAEEGSNEVEPVIEDPVDDAQPADKVPQQPVRKSRKGPAKDDDIEGADDEDAAALQPAKPFSRKRKKAAAPADVDTVETGFSVDTAQNEESLIAKSAPAPKKTTAKQRKNNAVVTEATTTDDVPATDSPSLAPSSNNVGRAEAIAAAAAEAAAVEAEEEQKRVTNAKKRKLNPGRKVSMDPNDVENQPRARPAAVASKVPQETKSLSAITTTTTLPSSSASSSFSSAPTVLSLSQRAAAFSSDQETRTSSGTTKPSLPNVNAKKRMVFGKRTVTRDPEQLAEILKGYGL
ncbi:hypothetical protein HKX48_001488 [Thoreauomyces humboldtii]|nr:hypothetical protein HKX48_001488 [Thoreauomyces humboldtii]